MNPLGFALLIVGLVLLVVGFKGKQDNLISAITGHAYGHPSIS